MTVLKIKQGATYSFGFTWMKVLLDGDGLPVKNPDNSYVLDGPHDLDGCLVRMQIRKKAGAEVLVTATSANAFSEPGVIDQEAVAAGAGRIILEGGDGSEKGHIRVRLTDLDTMLLDIKTGVFDLEVQWPQQPDEIRPEVDRPLEGTVEVSANVTVP